MMQTNPIAVPDYRREPVGAVGHADTLVIHKTYMHFFPDARDAYMARISASLAAPSAQVTLFQRAK